MIVVIYFNFTILSHYYISMTIFNIMLVKALESTVLYLFLKVIRTQILPQFGGEDIHI